MSHRSSQILNRYFKEHKTDYEVFKFLKKAYGINNFKMMPTEWIGEDGSKVVMYTCWVDTQIKKWLSFDTKRLEEYQTDGIETCMDCPYVVIDEEISSSLELMLNNYIVNSQVQSRF